MADQASEVNMNDAPNPPKPGATATQPGESGTETSSSALVYADDGMLVDPTDRVLVLPRWEEQIVSVIVPERRMVQRMAINIQRHGLGSVTNEQHMMMRTLLRALKQVEMTPKIRDGTQMELFMKLVYNDERFDFPKPYAALAKSLHEGWKAINWGAGEIKAEVDSGSDTEDDEPEKGGKAKTAIGPRPAPPGHMIYGKRGIMRGILVRKTKTTSYLLDPTYTKRKSAKAFGHNGLTVGAWWPRQICALRDGAHGVKMGGISGNIETGAYSILVAAGYEGMDDDQGDVLIYSGSDSHKNEDKKTIIRSMYTQCLERSLSTQQPVRVLRSSRGRHVCSPAKGLRYDGLYKVTKRIEDFNEKGGLYLKFKLIRLPDQPVIDTTRPTKDELYEEAKVEDGY